MNKLFFNYYISNGVKLKKQKPYLKIILWILFFSLFGYAISTINFHLNFLGWEIFKKNLFDMFSFNNIDNVHYPSENILNLSLKYLQQTIKFVSLGTLLGFSLACFTSLLCFKKFFNKFFIFIIRILIMLLRAFPALIFLYATQSAFEKEFAAFLIIGWFTWLWSTKYLNDIFAEIDDNAWEVSIKNGSGKLKTFWNEIFLRQSSKVFMTFMYGYESNIRWTTLLGSIGLIGIGSLINQNVPNNFENIGYPLLSIFISVVSIEFFIWIYNQIVLKDKLKLFKKSNIVFNYKKFFQFLTICIIIGFSIFALITIKFDFGKVSYFFTYFSSIFKINIDSWNSTSNQINPWLMIFDLFLKSFIVIVFTFIFSIILAIFSNQNITNKFFALLNKFIIGFVRIFPIFVLFFVFAPVIFSPISIAILVMFLHYSSILSQQIAQSINAISKNKIEKLKLEGRSKKWIIWNFILPTIKSEIFHFTFFAFININKALVTLGVFGTSLLGSTINSFEQRNNLENMFSVVVPLILYNFSLEVVGSLFRKRQH